MKTKIKGCTKQQETKPLVLGKQESSNVKGGIQIPIEVRNYSHLDFHPHKQ